MRSRSKFKCPARIEEREGGIGGRGGRGGERGKRGGGGKREEGVLDENACCCQSLEDGQAGLGHPRGVVCKGE